MTLILQRLFIECSLTCSQCCHNAQENEEAQKREEEQARELEKHLAELQAKQEATKREQEKWVAVVRASYCKCAAMQNGRHVTAFSFCSSCTTCVRQGLE